MLNEGSSRVSQPRSYRISDNSGTDLRLADFNEDRRLDVVVTTVGADGMRSVNVLLGQGEDGFGAPQLVAPNEKVNGIQVGDFNADGHWDIAVGSSSVEGDAPLGGWCRSRARRRGRGRSCSHGRQGAYRTGRLTADNGLDRLLV
ncbi:VCBS repeat-containing protein, partial [Polyangium sp. 15x6]|uniref:FG-GAP repeat domain-containing protein n=1 Tax=Polyangium sp. 15x6 TaxID=3042687 RepID=UPI00249C28AC